MTKNNFFNSLKNSLSNTRKYLGENFFKLFKKQKNIDNSLYEKIEDQLIIADVGIHTTQHIIQNLLKKINLKKYTDTEKIYKVLKKNMLEILNKIDIPLIIKKKLPFIFFIAGINGVGKTTTVAKLAYYYKKKKFSVMLVAADNFRAAAPEQLKILGDKINIPVFIQKEKKDSSSIIFEAIKKSQKKKIDILIIDTAGRLHNKSHLMEELKKNIKTIKKIDVTAPHEIMLVIDANIGQNSINQVKAFKEKINITGITLTKMDGSSKGGTLFNIANQFSIPIRYIGTGEKIEDLKNFKAKDFIDAIFF